MKTKTRNQKSEIRNGETRLIVAASETDPDMLYATKFWAPDPFIFLERNGKRTLVLSDLEIDRGRKQAHADEFVMFSKFENEGHVKTLTSEMLRAEIDSTILRAGGIPGGTIVAGGDQACDPHERGFGPLYADSLIILDVFPREAKTGYFGDMTRTVLRGRASEAQRKLWETVKAGQALALRRIKAGLDGMTIHKAIQEFFASRGLPTEIRKGRRVGFFHGTGHGLGLEIHEHPRLQKVVLKDRQVLTVEPGLYYPGLGGVRLEDVVLVKKTGCKILSRFPKQLEI